MIFVTVGAYDLPFNRLVEAIDNLVASKAIEEEVFMQIGHSNTPKSNLKYERFLPFDKMNSYADDARIIISQGGPGSIMLALTKGKIPIVIPRQKKYGEMVDNHQVLFSEHLEKERKILLVRSVNTLIDSIVTYEESVVLLKVSNDSIINKAIDFAKKLEELIFNYQMQKQ